MSDNESSSAVTNRATERALGEERGFSKKSVLSKAKARETVHSQLCLGSVVSSISAPASSNSMMKMSPKGFVCTLKCINSTGCFSENDTGPQGVYKRRW
jgi:hypothetical protein